MEKHLLTYLRQVRKSWFLRSFLLRSVPVPHRSLRPSVITACSLACGDMQILRGCGDGELVQPDSNDLQRVVRLQPVHATPTGLAQRPSTTTTTSSCCQSTRAVVISGRQQACARVYTVRRTDGGRVQSSRPPRSDHHRRRRFLPPRNRQHRAVLTRTRSRKGQDFNQVLSCCAIL